MSTEETIEDAAADMAEPFKDLAPIGDTKVAPAHGIAALALTMAMKYHDMGMVKDGALYQQYKLEGRNIITIGLEDVFETAMKIEAHLLGSSDRIAKMIVDAIEFKIDEDETPQDEGDARPMPSPNQTK